MNSSIVLIFDLLSYFFVILFVFNLFKVNYFNPIVKIFVNIYKPIAKINIFPSQLITIFLIALLIKFTGFYLSYSSSYDQMTLALVSLIKTISIIFRVMFFAIIGSVILSWVAPNNNHPLLALINEISSGVLDPVRKYIPAFGGLDFSPLFALILFNQLEILLNSILRSII